jgi:hypothetical protein
MSLMIGASSHCALRTGIGLHARRHFALRKGRMKAGDNTDFVNDKREATVHRTAAQPGLFNMQM